MPVIRPGRPGEGDVVHTSPSFIGLRVALLTNAAVAAAGLAVKFRDAARLADPQFPSTFGRLANEVCYFTIQSNLIVIGVCVALALRPVSRSTVLHVLRLAGLVAIVVTGIVYHAILASDSHYTGVAAFADALVHTVSPILYVLTWLLLGPRDEVTVGRTRAMLVYPAFWIALTLVRGSIIHIYPYGFVDVTLHGYVTVLVTIAALSAGAYGLAVLARLYDRRLAHGRVDQGDGAQTVPAGGTTLSTR
jgi:hypothetical protein